MENNVEIYVDKMLLENAEALLSEKTFNDLKDNMASLSCLIFEKTESGRKEAKQISRRISTLKSKITDKFDEIIKSEKQKNDEFVRYLKSLTSTKTKYLLILYVNFFSICNSWYAY
jgi:regulator of replication initiation timing